METKTITNTQIKKQGIHASFLSSHHPKITTVLTSDTIDIGFMPLELN